MRDEPLSWCRHFRKGKGSQIHQAASRCGQLLTSQPLRHSLFISEDSSVFLAFFSLSPFLCYEMLRE